MLADLNPSTGGVPKSPPAVQTGGVEANSVPRPRRLDWGLVPGIQQVASEPVPSPDGLVVPDHRQFDVTCPHCGKVRRLYGEELEDSPVDDPRVCASCAVDPTSYSRAS